MVARLNIELFYRKLSEEMNETKRQILLRLVAEEKVEVVRRVAVGRDLVLGDGDQSVRSYLH
jgi:hypothetical protein